jgi:hypothetical protein
MSPLQGQSGLTGQNISSYDYTISNAGKQIRLKMESIKGERVYSSFVDGVLIASARMPEASDKTGDPRAFDRYLKASSDALVQAGVDPKIVGLSYVNAAFDDGSINARALREAAEAQPGPTQYEKGVTPGKAQ